MRSPPSCHLAAPLVAVALAAVLPGARAQLGTIVPETAAPAAVEACERSARQAVPASAREPAEVTFNGPPSVQQELAIDGQQVLRGAGRWRGASGMRSFTYTCNVDQRTSEAVGLVLRDTTPVAAKAPPPRPPAEPDLSQLSPAACESSAVAALKERWPRVSQIAFDPRTRTFRQPSASSALLHGSVQAVPTIDSPSRLLGFDCEIDPRSGRVLRISISG
ncbi:MAG: hypothetical protein K8R60_10160 [Burkholderiales bacterium]|nr:hypothetical protein [Burkholderiales bacterium]